MALLLAQLRQQRAPRRIGQRGECAIERAFIIVNHVVNYLLAPRCRQTLKPWSLRASESEVISLDRHARFARSR